MKMKPATLKKLRAFAVKYANTKIPKRTLLAGINQDPSYGWYVDDWAGVHIGATEKWDLNFCMGWGKPSHLYVFAYPCTLHGDYFTPNMKKDYKVITFKVLQKNRKVVLEKE